MNRLVQGAARRLGAILLAGAAAGCTALQPYRTTDANPPPACEPDAQYLVPPPCHAAVVERSAHYDLYFTEFTDQGLQFPSEAFPQPAAYQINRTLQGLKETAAAPGVRGISLVVFVHGWKHDARHDDENVRGFRALLQSAGLLEQARGSGYRVAGVYVGWRGRSLQGEPLASLSFWTRKSAALRVAQGSTRELLSRLRNFKCTQSQPADGDCDEAAAGAKRPRVRMLLVGHSFGGWIVYNAVAGSLVESLTHAHNTDRPGSANSRFGDMVVLLNPAFEATRYTPLHRIATTTPQARYQAPLLVSVTSWADWATRTAFPAGRFFNSLFERTVGEEERVASIRTMGHVDDYLTHELRATGEQPAGCAGWLPLKQVAGAEAQQRQARVNLAAERANAEAFHGARASLSPGWQRTFCGGAQLTHIEHDPNSIIWNVRTDGSIMNGHNDIDDPKLIDFVRQLYHDTLLYPLADGSDAVPADGTAPAGPAAAWPAAATQTAAMRAAATRAAVAPTNATPPAAAPAAGTSAASPPDPFAATR